MLETVKLECQSANQPMETREVVPPPGEVELEVEVGAADVVTGVGMVEFDAGEVVPGVGTVEFCPAVVVPGMGVAEAGAEPEGERGVEADGERGVEADGARGMEADGETGAALGAVEAGPEAAGVVETAAFCAVHTGAASANGRTDRRANNLIVVDSYQTRRE